MKDKVFQTKRDTIAPFEFNKDVAAVFDDMLSRSIPYYKEINFIILDILKKLPQKKIKILDIGCSTAEIAKLIDNSLDLSNKEFEYHGVDDSKSMLIKAEDKLENLKLKSKLFCCKIEDFPYNDNYDFIIMNYTLQFISPDLRVNILEKIYTNLDSKSYFFLAEKIKSNSKLIESIQTELYYDFKRRNGYSELEISQKREALENVMLPNSVSEQLGQLNNAGFEEVDNIFRWYNFASYLAYKK